MRAMAWTDIEALVGLEREIFAEVPPRVEYRLSVFGRRFSGLLAEIEKLEAGRRS